ncbi:MAG: ribonuclease E [Verrucomicrobiota bacterium]|nr:ribonuclease E [Verrucomicrobiota bacterium]
MNYYCRAVRTVLFASFLAVSTSHAALTFSFTYTDGAGTGFNDPTQGAARQSALQSAANTLGSYFTNTANVTFTVASYSSNDGTLAFAGSSSFGANGFNKTVVQNKIITGNDVNGGSADGEIHVNLFHDWSFTDSVPNGFFDFKSTAMHEVMHTLGFSSFISSTGQGAFNNDSGDPDFWNVFDQFLTNKTGTNLIKPDFSFDTTQLSTLTGGPNNGVFFSGPNAVSAYGGRVPIYSPISYQEGSSGSHTDDEVFTGINQLLMNSTASDGLGIRSLSAVELGMLKDIGYSVVPEPATVGFIALIALAFTCWTRRRK